MECGAILLEDIGRKSMGVGEDCIVIGIDRDSKVVFDLC